MAKIILSKGDTVLREITLLKERVTIGRRPHNDIVIDNLAVSAEHAVIVTLSDDSFLEDLNSTNGTQVNGQPVKKHFLQDNDVIELAQYTIRYCADVIGEGSVASRLAMVSSATLGMTSQPRVKVLNGAKAGQETVLSKVITTVGHPGVQIAVITQRSDGYYLTHVQGNSGPLVNGESIGTDACLVMHGDVIDLSGTLLQFLLN